MRKLTILALGLGLIVTLSACGTATKEKLGLSRKAPNEFMVEPRPPLSVPPEYNLRPVTEPQPVNQIEAELSPAEQSLVSQLESK